MLEHKTNSSSREALSEHDHQTSTHTYDQAGTFPPRSTKHQKRKRSKRKQAKRSMLLVRIIFFTFLSTVLTIIVFLLWQKTSQATFSEAFETLESFVL